MTNDEHAIESSQAVVDQKVEESRCNCRNLTDAIPRCDVIDGVGSRAPIDDNLLMPVSIKPFANVLLHPLTMLKSPRWTKASVMYLLTSDWWSLFHPWMTKRVGTAELKFEFLIASASNPMR